MNLLFICSRNEWRSPTAEALFKGHNDHSAKSAGTSPSARIKVVRHHLAWADLIFVMERKHLQQMKRQFGEALDGKEVIILDIADEYRFMDEELVAMLELSVHAHLKER